MSYTDLFDKNNQHEYSVIDTEIIAVHCKTIYSFVCHSLVIIFHLEKMSSQYTFS